MHLKLEKWLSSIGMLLLVTVDQGALRAMEFEENESRMLRTAHSLLSRAYTREWRCSIGNQEITRILFCRRFRRAGDYSGCLRWYGVSARSVERASIHSRWDHDEL